jgi:hypothetical protein
MFAPYLRSGRTGLLGLKDQHVLVPRQEIGQAGREVSDKGKPVFVPFVGYGMELARIDRDPDLVGKGEKVS